MKRAILVGIVAALLGCLTFPAAAWADEKSTATAAQVDKLLVAELFADGKEKPAPRAGDETFLRRVSLDLIGQLPSPEQTIAFSLDPAENKRAVIVDSLLADPRFGANWGAYWRDVIMYRSNDQRARIAAEPLTRYLAGQFNRGASWDKVATAMLTARGDVRENGATGLIMAQLGRPAETTAEVSRIFLGIQLQCAQCHDHKTDRWKREQFHQLAAFFPRVAVRPVRNGTMRSFSVVADDNPPRRRRPNNNNRYAGTLEYFMPDLDNPKAPGTRMTPTLFTSGQTLKLGTPDAVRRSTLAKWITDKKNPWFAKAFVNRIWAEMVGEGFYEPIDDMGPDRKPSAPKTIDYLAGWFAESGYNVKALYRTIAATEAYQRESRSRRTPKDKPFAASCPQRLRADQLFAQLDRA
ncbi:MAG: DUF1549 domain-containing protein, partial [Planctomycetes bacterium]|nr:DUF1549 domain-containing protein [Planctomycetota bacterium]